MNENKLPTAEEWLENHKELSIYDIEVYDEHTYSGVNEKALYKIMTEFAKLHCKAQLEAILKNVEMKEEYWEGLDGGQLISSIDENSIINAYDLTQIK